ncbi:MAG: lycopene cyclase [Runella slithyformis]|nr:MAG: lycopene cyclase [Runella slithyformis]
MTKYDYIIAGGGLSGLSLAYYLNHSTLRNKSVLIIDQDNKTKNDRTWSFWEKGEQNAFESVVHRKWKQVYFYGNGAAKLLHLSPYFYKWMRGIDFYNFVKADLATNPHITFRQERIERITDTPDGGFVTTEKGQYLAQYVFDSVYALKLNESQNHNMLQHFKGWEISTPKPVFDTQTPIMMDYRVPQRGLGVYFCYVLPESPTRAMVEHTVFSDALWPQEQYDAELTTYLKDVLKISEFKVEQVEYGVIPMTDEPAPTHVSKHIMRIGTAGGFVKASSGYAFQRTQRFTQQIVENLVTVGNPHLPKKTTFKHFKGLLDSTLLNVLLQSRYSGEAVFASLYLKNPTPRLFAFLDEDTSLWQDLQTMATVPLWPFTKGMLAAVRKRIAPASPPSL